MQGQRFPCQVHKTPRGQVSIGQEQKLIAVSKTATKTQKSIFPGEDEAHGDSMHHKHSEPFKPPCHGRVTVSYLGSSSSGSPSAPWSGHTQQERPHPAAGRPAGAQQLRERAGTEFPGRKPCHETGKESAAWFSYSHRAHLCSLPGSAQPVRTWERLELGRDCNTG